MAYEPPKVCLNPKVIKWICVYVSIMFFPAVIMMLVIRADMTGMF